MFLDRLAARIAGGFLLAEGDAATGGGEQGGVAPPAERTLMQGGGEGGDQGGDNTAAPAWGDNWREALAGDDQKALARLQRMATPGDLFKSYREIETKLSGRQTIPALAEGATEEEVAAYRKAAGVPDKADGYGFAFPAEMNASEEDNAALGAFAQFMHDRHVPPAAAKAAFDFYLQTLTSGRAEQAERIQEMTLEQAAELRKEFPGREFIRHFGDRSRGTVGLVGEFLSQGFEGDEAQKALNDVLNARLPNGIKVGDYAPFLKGMASLARSYADEEAIVGGDGAGGGKSIDDEYGALIKESVANPKEFNANQSKVARLNELATARVRRDERGRFVAA